MTPQEFLEEVVRPNVRAFHEDYSSFRHAFNAVTCVDALAAHLYVWCKANDPAEVAGHTDDSAYRTALAKRNDAFRLLRDMAKAMKHVRLDRPGSQVTGVDRVDVREVGFGVGPFGHGRWGGPPQVVVDIGPGGFRYVEEVVDEALAFVETEVSRLAHAKGTARP